MADDLTNSDVERRAAPGSEIVTPLSTRTLFWRARYLRRSPFLTHVPFLFWLIETLRPASVVKLGLGDGVGYFAACQALARIEQGAEAVAMEPRRGETADAEWERLWRYNEDSYAEFSTLLQGDLRGAAHRFPDGAIDLLIVDTEMDEGLIEVLGHDWPRKLSERAVVLFHGSRSRFADGAAAGFLGRVRALYPTAHFEAREGLLMVLYGPARQDRLVRLTELRPGLRGFAEIHNVFRRLGATHEFECASRERTTSEETLQARLRAAEEELSRLRAELAERAPAHNAADEEQASVGEAELAALRADARTHFAEIARLTATIERIEEDRLREVDALKGEIAKLRAERDALLASTSWRITAPLRRIVLATRGRR